jgi:YggT family protein
MFVSLPLEIARIVLGFVFFVFFLRFWLQLLRAPFSMDFVQSLYVALAPVLSPLEKIIPRYRSINLACVLVLFVIALVYAVIACMVFDANLLSRLSFIAAWGFVIESIYWAFFFFLIAQVILSYVEGRGDMRHLARFICWPLLKPFARVPPIGPFALDVPLALLCLYVIRRVLHSLVTLI